ncbi:MAG: transglutaminase-like putative cysteine protease [Dokdonia sp.]|jgi:transglutaminase-like putative cysteine protease
MRLFLLCCILLQSTLLFSQNPLELQAVILPSDLKENSDSIIRDEQITVNIPDQRTLEHTVYRVITVLNKKGMSDINAIAYYDKDSRVKKLEATIYNNIGEEIKKIKKSEFRDVSAVDGGTLFSDSRIKYLDYTPVSYPFTVVFNSSTVSSDTAFIPFWYPNNTYQSSTAKSVYTITCAPDLELKYKLLNPDEQIVITESTGKIEVSVKNYTAFVPEAYSPGFKKIVPKVIFALNKFHLSGVDGNAEDWTSYGKWMDDYLLKGTRELSQETKNEILNLVAGETNKIEKARKIYEYVQEKTRYISVQIGIGGWKPMLASEVDALGYGDCKALTNYTKSLLEVAEIPSYYTILYAGGDKRDIQPDFVSMQGNHAILSIPDGEGYVWLECTSQEIPFGFIGSFTDDRDVVIITPEGGKIVHTDIYDHSKNTQYVKGVCKITPEGAIEAEVTMQSKGIQYNQRYYLESQINSDQKKYYYKFWRHINNMKIDAIDIENNRRDIVMNEKITFSADNYASFAGEEMLVSLNAVNRYTNVPKRYKKRNLELYIDRGFVDEDEVVVTVPDTYKLPDSFENIHVESEFGMYDVTFERIDDTHIKYIRKFSMYDGTFSKEQYKDFRSFVRKIVRYDDQKIVLTKI